MRSKMKMLSSLKQLGSTTTRIRSSLLLQQYNAASRVSLSTLVVSEPIPNEATTLPAATLAAITAATQISPSGPIKVLAVVRESPSLLTSLPSSVSSLVFAKSPPSSSFLLAEVLCDAIQQEMNKNPSYTHVVTAATKFGNNFLPRLGAIMGVSPITDVIQVEEGGASFIRPTYAGNALVRVHPKRSSAADCIFLSVRNTAFEKATCTDRSGNSILMEEWDIISTSPSEKIQWKGEHVSKSDRPDLTSARVVVSGGRGLKSGENFVLLEKLADKLGGAGRIFFVCFCSFKAF